MTDPKNYNAHSLLPHLETKLEYLKRNRVAILDADGAIAYLEKRCEELRAAIADKDFWLNY